MELQHKKKTFLGIVPGIVADGQQLEKKQSTLDAISPVKIHYFKNLTGFLFIDVPCRAKD